MHSWGQILSLRPCQKEPWTAAHNLSRSASSLYSWSVVWNSVNLEVHSTCPQFPHKGFFNVSRVNVYPSSRYSLKFTYFYFSKTLGGFYNLRSSLSCVDIHSPSLPFSALSGLHSVLSPSNSCDFAVILYSLSSCHIILSSSHIAPMTSRQNLPKDSSFPV